jgi:hypothetical protein
MESNHKSTNARSEGQRGGGRGGRGRGRGNSGRGGRGNSRGGPKRKADMGRKEFLCVNPGYLVLTRLTYPADKVTQKIAMVKSRLRNVGRF